MTDPSKEVCLFKQPSVMLFLSGALDFGHGIRHFMNGQTSPFIDTGKHALQLLTLTDECVVLRSSTNNRQDYPTYPIYDHLLGPQNGKNHHTVDVFKIRPRLLCSRQHCRN
ncbi:hypothetical protein CSKR_112579 [Clonorchis sinensis]|uniref:Uncharacterized protein n=1 Tax=Clonorchis sinensis TaxID=79923 RepID=A0A419Q9N5_CLOSI|nr:hypothetical protein CSKR_112579 [Clonorchis sinensis]